MSDLGTEDAVGLREQVRARYAAAARVVSSGGGGTADCCGPAPVGSAPALNADCCGPGGDSSFGQALYGDTDLAALPEATALASLGCGNPTAVAELRAGETVLDLGSGGGIDVLLSAERVGPEGKAYGLDMTDEMLELARHNAALAGFTNVEFLKGLLEDIPLPACSVDVIISNCVINLSTDKAAVLGEIFRVLRPAGRIGISDVVAEDELSPAEREARGSYVGCIAGALSKAEYEQGLRQAGFAGVSVTFTHEVADSMHAAIIRATKA
ncbi:MAG: arsenite methyltransferase [Acidimicrobiales bacterium]